MAVITPHFPRMSLIHLTVCYPLCCSPSILIKSELNDQQWVCAGARPSQHTAVAETSGGFYLCALTLTDTHELASLSLINANLLWSLMEHF